MSRQTSQDPRQAHRDFLNRYYGAVRRVYDVTRRYYLFGRDTVLNSLLGERWDSLIEVGPGTGRNLRKLQRRRPAARYGGIDASDAMLEIAQARCPWATLRQGFAEDCDYTALLGSPPERVLFSYCLSMVQDADSALANARGSLAAGGQVVVVDFGDLKGVPLLAGPLERFLRSFHVEPLDAALLRRHGAELRWGPGRYFVTARMGPMP